MADKGTGADPRGKNLWSMGAVSQRTGLSEHTLRAWEKRFGFPDPVRLASGHRRYTAEQVSRLMAIQSALVRGHRIGDVIHLDEPAIVALLSSDARATTAEAPAVRSTYLDASLKLDAESLATMMRYDAAALGMSRFLVENLVPFLKAIGENWQEGTLSIRHEHVSSEVIEDVLRELRAPLERGLSGRPVVLGSLPGEQHSLGLQIVALRIISRGVPVRVLGTQTPVEEFVESALELDAVSVAISISEPGVTVETARDFARLRAALPDSVALWIGGAGARRVRQVGPNVRFADGLEDVDDLVAGIRERSR